MHCGQTISPRSPLSGGCRAAPALLLAVWLAAFGAASDTQPAAGSGRGAIISIRGEIDDIMRDSIRRRLDEALAGSVKTVVFEMDTPGGAVSSALDICRMIKNTPPDVRTVAWVHPEAYSAGAMISVACDEIWMSPSSSIGDCAPLLLTPTGVQELGGTERAKAESPILQEFRDSAARNGYDPLLSRAMVTVGEEVWWLQSVNDPGKREFFTTEDKKKLIDELEPDRREWQLVESYLEPGSGKTIKVSQPVDRAGELLTMSQYDAVAFGFARGIAADKAELAARLNLLGPPMLFERSGWEAFAAWLNSPIVRGILLVIVLIGGYVEFQHPGVILPGAVALIALAIFLAAPYAAGLANVWTIILFVVGLVLLGIEIFVLPGFGIAGLIAIALILVAIVASFVPAVPNGPPLAIPTLEESWKGLMTGIKVLISSTLVSLVGILLLARYLPRSRLASGMISENPQGATLALSDAHPTLRVGDIGLVTGDLRPGGQARFGHDVVDVASQGEYVEAGQRVQVIRLEGMNVIVRALPPEGQAANQSQS